MFNPVELVVVDQQFRRREERLDWGNPVCARNAYARKRGQSVQRGNTYIKVKTRDALFSTRPTSEIPVPGAEEVHCANKSGWRRTEAECVVRR